MPPRRKPTTELLNTPCPDRNKIRNPKTGICVSREGKIGKKILEEIRAAERKSAERKSKSKSPKRKSRELRRRKPTTALLNTSCPDRNKIRNPKTGICVSREGKIGKKILEEIRAERKSPERKSRERKSHERKSRKRKSPPSYTDAIFDDIMKRNKIDITYKQLPFKLEDKIGEGTYGVVFKVTYNGKPAVLKVFKQTYGTVREDELREVYNSLYLSGKKYFPKVYKIFYTNDNNDETQFFMLSEYIEGNPLSKVIHKITDTNKILDIRNQVIKILDWFCDNNVIHADFHPGNILITKNEQLKVIDFGFAYTHNKCDRHMELVNLIAHMHHYKTDKKFMDSFIEYYRDNYYKNDICFTTNLNSFYYWLKKHNIKDLKNAAKDGKFSLKYFELCYKFHVSTHKDYTVKHFNYKKKSTFKIYSNDEEVEVDFNDYKNYFEELI